MFGKHLGYIVVLTLLTSLVFGSTEFKKAVSFNEVAPVQVAAAKAVVPAPQIVEVEDTAVICPVGYTCVPEPKVKIEPGIILNGPNPQVVSYRFNLAGVDRLEIMFSLNGSYTASNGITAHVHGTKNNALGKTVINTKGHTMAEFVVDVSNKTGKDILAGIKAIGYAKNKQVGGDGDAMTLYANPTKPFCPWGYKCTVITPVESTKMTIVSPVNGQVFTVNMQNKIVWTTTSPLTANSLFDITLTSNLGKELIVEGITRDAANCQMYEKGIYTCVAVFTPKSESTQAKITISERGTNNVAYSDTFSIKSNKPLSISNIAVTEKRDSWGVQFSMTYKLKAGDKDVYIYTSPQNASSSLITKVTGYKYGVAGIYTVTTNPAEPRDVIYAGTERMFVASGYLPKELETATTTKSVAITGIRYSLDPSRLDYSYLTEGLEGLKFEAIIP
jgi:hypothetical protein